MNLFEEASHLLDIDRQAEYGDPQESAWFIATLWSSIFGVTVSPSQVFAALMAIKVRRFFQSYQGQTQNHQRDSVIDLVAYAKLWDDAVSKYGC